MSTPDQDNSFLNLSDEEIMNMAPPEPVVVEPTPVVVEPEPENIEPEDEHGEVQTPEEKVIEQEPTPEQDTLAEGDTAGAAKAVEPPPKTEPSSKEPAPEKNEQTPEVPPVKDEVDYKAEYQKLLAPFKANGREITVKNVDDAVALMQMGANYNKKMAALKPNLRLLKMLENNGLLDEAKLSFLIDLDKKNPEAVTKLVKDSGLDPLDLDAEKAAAYKPSPYKVDDREVELDAVLDEIQSTPSYNRTLGIVSKEWDGQSKQVIADTPQLLKVINSHVESGIYDLINREIESERTFGRLSGLSDIEAYRQVGDRLHAQGAFAHLEARPASQRNQAPAPAVVVPPKPKMGSEEDKLREKRRAASSTTAVKPVTQAADFNPLSLSDADFAKLVNTQFL